MEDKKLVLNEYEVDTLKTTIERYTQILEDQIKDLKRSKYSSKDNKKDVIRNIEKKINLLKEVYNKLN